MTTATAKKPSTAVEIVWQTAHLEAGDFAALSSDRRTWYDGNIFSAACACPARTFHPDVVCKHALAARAEYWTQVDALRREQAERTKRWLGVGPLSEHDLAGAPSWEPYYAPLERSA